MCAPSPPAPPDYTLAAQEQGAANLETARAQGKMNNPNVISPYGTQNVTYGTGGEFDPAGYLAANPDVAASGMGALEHYNNYGKAEGRAGVYTPTTAGGADHPTVTQTFSPEQQALYDQQNTAKGLMGGLGIQGAQSLQGVVGKPVDFSGGPARPDPYQINQNVVNAMMQRPMADYGRAVDQNKSDMAAAGIPVGSKAYNTQQELMGRQLTDAQTQAGLAGIQAGNTWFNQGQAARGAANTEYLAQRQTPLNEITALLSGSQTQNPFTMPGYAQNTQVQAAPLFSATQQQGNWNADMYNAEAAQAGNMQSGLFGLGSSGIMAGAMM